MSAGRSTADPLDRDALGVLVAALERPDGVIAGPTDTVYGLFCAYDHPDAIERIYALKGRSEDKPLALVCHSLEALASRMDLSLSAGLRAVLDTALPGPLTLLVGVHPPVGLSPRLLSPGPTLAFRIPDCPALLAVARALGRPLASTSANRSGEAPAAAAEAIHPMILRGVDRVLDIGPAPFGQPSTILDLTRTSVRVIRAGALEGQALASLLSALDRANR